MTIIQDLGILEAIAGDVQAFAAGQPITQTVGGYTVSVVLLPNGPTAQYQAFSGSVIAILELAFADYAAFSVGAPIFLAEKIGNTWYGTSLSKVQATVAPTPVTEPATVAH